MLKSLICNPKLFNYLSIRSDLFVQFFENYWISVVDSSPRSLTEVKTSLQPKKIHSGIVDRLSDISRIMLGLLHIQVML